MRDRVTIALVASIAAIAVSVVAAPALRALRPSEGPQTVPVVAPVATGPVDLPACDDDAPGRPVTGPCWLLDDGQLAVWPYPYAPAPIYRLEGWQP